MLKHKKMIYQKIQECLVSLHLTPKNYVRGRKHHTKMNKLDLRVMETLGKPFSCPPTV